MTDSCLAAPGWLTPRRPPARIVMARPEGLGRARTQDKPGVATQSIGEEPNRRVVVLPRNVRGPSRVPVAPAEPTVA